MPLPNNQEHDASTSLSQNALLNIVLCSSSSTAQRPSARWLIAQKNYLHLNFRNAAGVHAIVGRLSSTIYGALLKFSCLFGYRFTVVFPLDC